MIEILQETECQGEEHKITDDEWKQAEGVLSCLEPFKIVSDRVASERYPCVPQVLPHFSQILSTIKLMRLKSSARYLKGKAMAEQAVAIAAGRAAMEVLPKLESYKNIFESDLTFGVATCNVMLYPGTTCLYR